MTVSEKVIYFDQEKSPSLIACLSYHGNVIAVRVALNLVAMIMMANFRIPQKRAHFHNMQVKMSDTLCLIADSSPCMSHSHLCCSLFHSQQIILIAVKINPYIPTVMLLAGWL